MRNNLRFLTFVTLFTLCCSGAGCDSSLAPQGGKKYGIYQSSEVRAARQYFLQEWNQRFKKCGDSYYADLNPKEFVFGGNPKDIILEIKTSSEEWEIEPLSRSDADKANKIKWYCDLTVKAKMSSYYDKAEKKWSMYWDGTGAFWSQTGFAGGADIPIIFQVVEYEDGSHKYFYSNQYGGKINITNGAADYLKKSWNINMKPISDCSSLPPRN